MPPRINSRYRLDGLFRSTDNFLFTADREPFRFVVREDTRMHRAVRSDTLENLAERFFAGPNTARLWWIIADFQPEPIQDPTEKLVPGVLLFIPSQNYVDSVILGIVTPLAPKIV